MRTRLILTASLAVVAALDAQPQQERNQPTFRSGANYVRVDMYATRDGKPVNDLNAADIEVLEDGVPQKIEDFEHVVVRPAGDQQFRNEPKGLADSRVAAADPRARVFVVFLDTYHTQLEGSAIMRRPLVSFLDRVLGDDDLVALMTPEMAGSDIALGRKTAVISSIVSEEWWGRRARVAGQDPQELMYEQCIANDYRSTDNLERRVEARRQKVAEVVARRREMLTLDALEDLMTHLAGLRDERKAVVVVTEGWLLYKPNPLLAGAGSSGPVPPIIEAPVPPPSERGPDAPSRDRQCERDIQILANIDSESRFRGITEEANRGNVTFYPVYARGLAAFDAPIGPDKPPPILQDMSNLRTRHGNMRDLAAQTDGVALIDTNFIAEGLKRIADDLSSYYLFGYYSTNSKLDGRFRSITVRVKQQGVRVRARRGYRARTAAQVAAAAAAAAGDPVRPAVLNAMNAVAGISPRSTFRVRSSSWMSSDSNAGTAWVVGELDFRMLREPAWAAGARAEVILLGADGTQLSSTQIDLPAGQSSFSVRVPADGRLTPGDYAVRVRVNGRNRDDVASDTARIVVPERSSAVGEAVLWRRGTSTGPQYVRTADPRYQRSDRLRLELPTTATTATARLLDRAGKVLQVPVQVSQRMDADGIRWFVADLSLAPLAAGDYAIDVAAGEQSQITGFRIVP